MTDTTDKKPARRALAWIAQERWAIRAESLELITSIAGREHEPDFEAVLAKRGRALEEGASAEVRGRTAVIPVTGPIFRYANLFTMISGATSIDQLASDLRSAIDSPSIDTIVLEINSPGGMLAGTSELAQLIKESPKRVIAYVDGIAASAAYWIASAADQIVMNDTAQVGSIGVVTAVHLDDDPSVMEIVSSQSPGKRPDARTEGGRAQIQSLIDELADVFINTVAENRGVDRMTVLTEFGQGAMKVGATAIRAGMADRIGSLEGLLTELAGPASTGTRSAIMTKQAKGPVTVSSTAELQKAMNDGHTADEITIKEPDLESVRAEARTAGAKAERDRIQSVEAQLIPGHEKLISTLKFDGVTSGEQAAVQVLKAEREQRAGMVSGLRDDAAAAVVPAAAAPAAKPAVDPDQPIEDRCRAEWNASKDLRAEFESVEQYIAYTRAEAGGQVRVLKNRKSAA